MKTLDLAMLISKGLVFLLLPFLTLSVAAQDWQKIETFFPAQTLHCIRFASDDVGYTVSTLYNGSTYNIHKTTDGGETWIDQSSGYTATRFKDIHVFSEDTVMMCGNFGLVISTFDGGETWIADTVAENGDHLFGISFAGETGYVCGNSGAIYKTTNLGETWTQVNPPFITAIEEIYFLTEDFGFICGLNFIYYTENGGDTWIEPQSFPGATTNWWLREMVFTDENTGYVCGDIGQIYKTTDGGKNWIYLANSGTDESLQSMTVLSEDRLYACGFGGVVIRSSDGGIHWESMTAASSEHFRSIDFTPDGTGFISTQIGEVLRYFDPYLAVEEFGTENSITIYPNPAVDQVNFSIGGNAVIDRLCMQVKLYSAEGAFLGMFPTNKPLNVSELNKGTYILEFTEKNGKTESKLFFKR